MRIKKNTNLLYLVLCAKTGTHLRTSIYKSVNRKGTLSSIDVLIALLAFLWFLLNVTNVFVIKYWSVLMGNLTEVSCG